MYRSFPRERANFSKNVIEINILCGIIIVYELHCGRYTEENENEKKDNEKTDADI